MSEVMTRSNSRMRLRGSLHAGIHPGEIDKSTTKLPDLRNKGRRELQQKARHQREGVCRYCGEQIVSRFSVCGPCRAAVLRWVREQSRLDRESLHMTATEGRRFDRSD